MQLPDPVYHWLVDFFRCRSHCTKFGAVTSPPLAINSSVVQGSALGPPLFILALSDLRAKTLGNFYMKYADDVTMLIPASNSSSIPAELENVGDWSRMSNQSLSVAKSAEMVVSSRWISDLVQPPPVPGVARVDTLLLLGVVIDRHLLFSQHMTKTLAQAAQYPCPPGPQHLEAANPLPQHGLSGHNGGQAHVCLPFLVGQPCSCRPGSYSGCP